MLVEKGLESVSLPVAGIEYTIYSLRLFLNPALFHAPTFGAARRKKPRYPNG